jgi:prolyl 4-hydroxylase
VWTLATALRRIKSKYPLTVIGNEILFIDDFVSEATCKNILEELKLAFWRPSLTYTRQRDGTFKDVLSPFRVSTTAHQDWFSDELNTILSHQEKILRELFALKIRSLELWQATDYARYGTFDYHLDAGYWEHDLAGERILTFLLYLTTPLRGGGTHFRALDVYVEGKAGRLVVWANLFPNGDCDYRMIHSSTPLLRGRKTTLVTWQRQKAYRKERISHAKIKERHPNRRRD